MAALAYSPQQSAIPDPAAQQQQSATPAPQQQAAIPAAPPPQASPTPVVTGARGGVAIARSEPPPQNNKPDISPAAYHALARANPQLKQDIDDASQLTGVSPLALASIAHVENSFKSSNDVSTAGARGPMQVLPSTAHGIDPNGRFNIDNAHDNVMLGALYYRKLSDTFGADSPSAFAAYFEGADGVNHALAHPETAQQNYPKMFGYLNKIYGKPVDTSQLNAAANIHPQGFVQAATQGGPDAALNYMVQTGPSGMPVSDLWRNAESNLVGAFLLKGDIAGAQHARDFVLQLSHAGSNSYLMQAHQALSNGDGVGAAQALAKAHAFFPDGTVGQFRSNGTNVWADRLDENDPSRKLGPSFQVTPQGIAGLLNQTTDPQKYLETLNTQQAAAANARYKTQLGNYYQDLPEERRYAADVRGAATLGAAQERAGAIVQGAQIHAAGTVGAAEIHAAGAAGGGAAGQRAIEKEINDIYGQGGSAAVDADGNPADPYALGNMAETYKDLRTNGGLTGPQSYAVVQGLASKTLGLVPQQDGRVAATTPQGKPIAYLSPQIAAQISGAPLIPPAQQGALAPGLPAAQDPGAVGGSAMSSYARGAGISQNLSGTVMPQQPQPQQPTQ